MKRRDFLRNSSLASTALFVPSFVKAFEQIPNAMLGHKKLVIIQLSGGNDGLNTIVPYQNDIYYQNRPKLAIPKQKVIPLNNDLGLHPSLSPFKNLYEKGYLSIINNVGYPNPVRSHFRSADIWQTASDADEFKTSGWLGRYLDEYEKNAYSAIDVDDKLSLALKGNHKSGVAAMNYQQLYKNAKDPFFDALLKQPKVDEHLSEHNLGYLYQQMIQAKSSASYIYEKSKTYNSTKAYSNNFFGKQLKNTAQFINSHLSTKIYYVSMGGFDTHFNQAKRQQKLMGVFANNLETFIDDLKTHDTFKDTLVLVFSEFGRRVKENASMGTDHGTANNVFVLNQDLKKPGFYNVLADLNNLDKNGDLKYEIDFRTVYSTILEKWLDADAEKIIGKQFKPLNFI